MHQPIHIQNLSHFFEGKICFESFSTTVYPGSKIAIIGQNGCGKSTLLKLLQGTLEPSEGRISQIKDHRVAYVPQTINEFETYSGGQRFQKQLSIALASDPDILLLDEPTNHLDQPSRVALTKLLQRYQGTVFVATHDEAIIQACLPIIWCIEQQKIQIYQGNYQAYLHYKQNQLKQLKNRLKTLKEEKTLSHEALMKEKQRHKKTKAYGKKKYAGDKIALSGKKRQGQTTTANRQSDINTEKHAILQEIQNIRLPEKIKPTFYMETESSRHTGQSIIQINNGACGYEEAILKGIDFSLSTNEKISIVGLNGSGKSTFIKGILGECQVVKSGDWYVPDRTKIGYLDQHYSNLDPNSTVLEVFFRLMPQWSPKEIYRHLNDFLFKSPSEIDLQIRFLSGGEKCRLSLAVIAAKPPTLLILDEITNNIDIETKTHIIDVLKHFSGSMIAISHDKQFLTDLSLNEHYEIINSTLIRK